MNCKELGCLTLFVLNTLILYDTHPEASMSEWVKELWTGTNATGWGAGVDGLFPITCTSTLCASPHNLSVPSWALSLCPKNEISEPVAANSTEEVVEEADAAGITAASPTEATQAEATQTSGESTTETSPANAAVITAASPEEATQAEATQASGESTTETSPANVCARQVNVLLTTELFRLTVVPFTLWMVSAQVGWARLMRKEILSRVAPGFKPWPSLHVVCAHLTLWPLVRSQYNQQYCGKNAVLWLVKCMVLLVAFWLQLWILRSVSVYALLFLLVGFIYDPRQTIDRRVGAKTSPYVRSHNK